MQIILVTQTERREVGAFVEDIDAFATLQEFDHGLRDRSEHEKDREEREWSETTDTRQSISKPLLRC